LLRTVVVKRTHPRHFSLFSWSDYLYTSRNPSWENATMIDDKGLMGRRIRLSKLSQGLAKEVTLWTTYDPLTLTHEIQTYLKAIREAKEAIDRAHDAIARADRQPKDQSSRETRSG